MARKRRLPDGSNKRETRDFRCKKREVYDEQDLEEFDYFQLVFLQRVSPLQDKRLEVLSHPQ